MSADASVATVNQSGLVAAVGNGTTNLTATAGAATAVVAVTVEQVPSSIELSTPPDSLAVGDSIQMTAEALDDLGNLIANATFQWSSSDTTIATVDQEGWVHAWTGGSTEIKAAAGTTATATATLTAVQVVDSIVLSAPRDSLVVRASIRMTAEAPGTAAFQARRDGIRDAMGPYCATSAAAASDGAHRSLLEPITVELADPCTVRPAPGVSGTRARDKLADMNWTGSSEVVRLDPAFGCSSDLPDRPQLHR